MPNDIKRAIDFKGQPVTITITDTTETKTQEQLAGMMNWYEKQVQAFLDEVAKDIVPEKPKFQWRKK